MGQETTQPVNVLNLLQVPNVELCYDVVENNLEVLPFYDVELYSDVVENTLEVLPFYDVELTDVIESPGVRHENLQGANILCGLKEDPMDLLLSGSRTQWNEVVIPHFKIVEESLTQRRVVCVDDCIISGTSDVIVDLQLESPIVENKKLLIKPNPEFFRRSQLVVAYSVADVTKGESLKLKVSNRYPCDLKINAGETVGFVSPILNVIQETEVVSNLTDQNDAELSVLNSDSRKLNNVYLDHEQDQPADTESVQDHLKDLSNITDEKPKLLNINQVILILLSIKMKFFTPILQIIWWCLHKTPISCFSSDLEQKVVNVAYYRSIQKLELIKTFPNKMVILICCI